MNWDPYLNILYTHSIHASVYRVKEGGGIKLVTPPPIVYLTIILFIISFLSVFLSYIKYKNVVNGLINKFINSMIYQSLIK